MIHALVLSATVPFLTASVRAGDPAAPVKEKEIALEGEGSWDYATVDPAARRLYVAHSTRIDVIDTEKNEKVGQVEGLDGAHGTALVPELTRGFATSGKSDKLIVFDLHTLAKTGEVATGTGPDAVLYVTALGEVWAMNHRGGTITCVNAKTLEVSATIQIGGALEAAVEDPAKGLVFVNVEDRGLLAVIDARKHEVLRSVPVAPGEEPAGLALDAANGLLFVGCGNSKLIVLEAASGKVVGALDIGEHCDGVAFDPATANAFASCRGGSSAIHEQDAKTFRVLGTLDAGKTCALDPKTHKLYITSGTRGEKDSVRVLVFAQK